MLHLLQRPTVRLLLVGIVLLAVQTGFVAQFPVAGVRADVLLGASICGGIVGGAERGALAGFVLGLLFDLTLITPFGLSALVYGLVAFSAGAIKALITVGHAWWLTTLLVVVGSVAGILLFAGVGTIIGQKGWIEWRLVPEGLVVAAVNALIGVPLGRVMKWTLCLEREQ